MTILNVAPEESYQLYQRKTAVMYAFSTDYPTLSEKWEES